MHEYANKINKANLFLFKVRDEENRNDIQRAVKYQSKPSRLIIMYCENSRKNLFGFLLLGPQDPWARYIY